jgi:hypothetical protein
MKITGTASGEAHTVTPNMVASFLTAMQYHSKISLNLWTSLQNLTQIINTAAKGGIVNTLRAIPHAVVAQALDKDPIRAAAALLLPNRLNPARRDLVRLVRAGVLDSFTMKYERPVHHGIRESAATAMTYLFTESEQFNRRTAFFTGYIGAIKAGKSEEEAIQAGRDLVRDTQFFGGRLDGILWSRSPVGRVMMQFKSYPLKQAEFFFRRLNGRQKMKYLVLALMMGGPASLFILQLMKRWAPRWWATQKVQALQESFNLTAALHAERMYQSIGLYTIPAIEKIGAYDFSQEIFKFLAGPTVNAILDTASACFRLLGATEKQAREKAINHLVQTLTRSGMPGGIQILRWWRTAKKYDFVKHPKEFLRAMSGLEQPKPGKP